ncbi:hypothetical protein SDC9_197182 [bioreactor metagenome]|uniref:Uncharacterized protein n=1 Tax=bioreactor metagenome TaxID=1076179 RepID=A0A645IE06_9ZZZZ
MLAALHGEKQPRCRDLGQHRVHHGLCRFLAGGGADALSNDFARGAADHEDIPCAVLCAREQMIDRLAGLAGNFSNVHGSKIPLWFCTHSTTKYSTNLAYSACDFCGIQDLRCVILAL